MTMRLTVETRHEVRECLRAAASVMTDPDCVEHNEASVDVMQSISEAIEALKRVTFVREG